MWGVVDHHRRQVNGCEETCRYERTDAGKSTVIRAQARQVAGKEGGEGRGQTCHWPVLVMFRVFERLLSSSCPFLLLSRPSSRDGGWATASRKAMRPSLLPLLRCGAAVQRMVVPRYPGKETARCPGRLSIAQLPFPRGYELRKRHSNPVALEVPQPRTGGQFSYRPAHAGSSAKQRYHCTSALRFPYRTNHPPGRLSPNPCYWGQSHWVPHSCRWSTSSMLAKVGETSSGVDTIGGASGQLGRTDGVVFSVIASD